MNRLKGKRSISIMTGVIIIAVWVAVTRSHLVSGIILPSPGEIGESFVDLIQNGYKGYSLWAHLWATLRRLLTAYVLAAFAGIILGLLSGYSSGVRAVVEPIVAFIRPLPPLAYYSIIILWMGIGDNSKIFLLFIGGFAPVFLSCATGVGRVKQDYINRARTLGANRVQVFFHVLIPAAAPDIFVGLRNSMSITYSTSVAAEMVAASSGIGWMVLDAGKYLRSDVIFVGIIIMGITGILLDKLLISLEKKIVFWKGKG